MNEQVGVFRKAELTGDASNSKYCSGTCRRRKLKCDEALPSCHNCLRAKRYCDHRKDIIFRQHKLPDNQSAGATINDPPTALKSEETARLFHHYCNHLATWYDLSDGTRAFHIDVPHKALSRPLLFGAILAFSAIHVSRTTARSIRTLAQKYHSQCLKRLIAINETSEELSDGTALAAVCLLRSYEILAEDFDPNRHLSGAHALADSGRVKVDKPSLMRAGYFNYLREDITYSLQYQRPLKTSLKNLPFCITVDADEDQLNVASLFVARAINATFIQHPVRDDRARLLEEVKLWHRTLDSKFHPYSNTLITDYDTSFPHIWMLRDCHTSTLQYFLVCLTLLEVGEQVDAKVQRDLNQHATKVCGLAFTSNSPAVVVNSFGPISYCARFLQGQAIQHELIRRLQGARKDTGWPVQRIIDDLTECWRDS